MVLGFCVATLLLLLAVLFFIPKVKQRFVGLFDVLQKKDLDKTSSESTTVRILIWQEALTLLQAKPLLGTSPGDANDALYKQYQENGLTGAWTKKLNAHSQYFQTAVGLGFIGLISLFALFGIPFFVHSNKIMRFFLVLTALNFLTESMFQTMAGCIFFGYFYPLLAYKPVRDTLEQEV